MLSSNHHTVGRQGLGSAGKMGRGWYPMTLAQLHSQLARQSPSEILKESIQILATAGQPLTLFMRLPLMAHQCIVYTRNIPQVPLVFTCDCPDNVPYDDGDD